MEVITSVRDMEQRSAAWRADGRSIGFVPTMGALHPGHISLVQRAAAENDVVVVSVFVNPTQFNNAKDLGSYPRTFEADRQLLADARVQAMFFPSVEEMYPSETMPEHELDGLDAFMEGPHRPGHFNGVVQVVSRLFDIVSPRAAYFGEKDFQQLAIIRHMSRKLGYPVDVVGCATKREPDGLAMSSRNRLLTPQWRIRAAVLFEVLEEVSEVLVTGGAEQAKRHALCRIEEQGLRPEYFELVCPDALRPVPEGWDGPVQVCVAAWAGDVRLIDNLRVK